MHKFACQCTNVLIIADIPVITPTFSNLECRLIYGEVDILATCVARLNSNVAIDCQYSSNPPGTINLDYVRTFEDNVRTVNSTRIEITNVATSNEGRYHCESSNIFRTGRLGFRSLSVTLRTTEGTSNAGGNRTPVQQPHTYYAFCERKRACQCINVQAWQ